MALTPKLLEGLMAAFHAPGVTLSRCCGGFFDRRKGPQSTKVTIRTANTLVETGMAVYNDPVVPSSLTVTPDGIQVALGELQAAAA